MIAKPKARRPLRVLIIGINYRPELTSVGPHTAALAEHLSARGDDVTVVTGLQHHPAWRGSAVAWAALAVAGMKRVLLVDADLRKPGVHKNLKLSNKLGLSTLLLAEGTALDSVLEATEPENLLVLTTGPLPPNPAELLGSRRFHTLLEQLTAAFDLVLIDSPPVQAVADAAILSAIVDGTLFVVDSGKTRGNAVQHGREALAKAGANVLGVSLNRLSKKARDDSYSYYYSQYGYGQGYGISAEEEGAARPIGTPAAK